MMLLLQGAAEVFADMAPEKLSAVMVGPKSFSLTAWLEDKIIVLVEEATFARK